MRSGWRPSDLPARTGPSWRTADGREIKFTSQQLPGSAAYLVFQTIAAMPLMLLVSHHGSPLLGWQKIAFSAALWAMATAWGGMLESKRWGLPLEAARVIAMGVCVLAWTPFLTLGFAWLAVSLGWLALVLLKQAAPQAVRG